MNAKIRQPGSFCDFSCACKKFLQLCANLTKCTSFIADAFIVSNSQSIMRRICVQQIGEGEVFFFQLHASLLGLLRSPKGEVHKITWNQQWLRKDISYPITCSGRLMPKTLDNSDYPNFQKLKGLCHEARGGTPLYITNFQFYFQFSFSP